MKAFHMSVLLGVLFLLPSCGGDSSGSGPKYSVDVGLPAATVLRDLSTEQQVNACEKLRDEVAARFDPVQTVARVCQLYGAAFTNDAQSCQPIADSCVTQTANGTNANFKTQDFDYAALLQCTGRGSGFAGCPLTVGDYEACFSDRMTAVSALLDGFSCADAATIDATTGQAAAKQLTANADVDSCQQLHSECPGVDPFPDADGTSSTGMP